MGINMSKWTIAGWADEAQRQAAIKEIDGMECCTVEIKQVRDKRTALQNRSLHKGFSNAARAMAEKGITKEMLFREISQKTEFVADESDVKEVFRAICEILYGKRTTTAIPTGDVKKVWDMAAMAFATRLGVDIGDYPCQESLMRQSEYF